MSDYRCADHSIHVWPWDDAPQVYRDLSEHGGDEDWVALVPEKWKDLWIPWLESGSSFGCCNVSRKTLSDGTILVIGAHA